MKKTRCEYRSVVDENYRLIEQDSSKDLLKMFVSVAFIALSLVLFIRTSIGTGIIVNGESMRPTLNSGDVGVCLKAPYKIANKKFERGDIVTIKTDDGMNLIKRVIGLPGETVEIRAGEVFINGQNLDEPYINKKGYLILMPGVPEDAAEFNLDSYKRDYRKTMAMNDEIEIFELGEEDYLCLGDNRMNSLDSRILGPFNRKEIQGKYFSK